MMWVEHEPRDWQCQGVEAEDFTDPEDNCTVSVVEQPVQFWLKSGDGELFVWHGVDYEGFG